MNIYDIRALEGALTECASFFGRKAPSELAVKVWLRKCKALPIDVVVDAFEHWMATAKGMPTIDEIVTRASDAYAARRRAQQAETREADPAGGVPMPDDIARQLVELFERMGNRPPISPRTLAMRQRDRHRFGHYVPQHILLWARAVLGSEFHA
jgi:hypothetical protein